MAEYWPFRALNMTGRFGSSSTKAKLSFRCIKKMAQLRPNYFVGLTVLQRAQGGAGVKPARGLHQRESQNR